MATFGSTPAFAGWYAYGPNDLNQVSTGPGAMPQHGVVTAIVFYASTDSLNKGGQTAAGFVGAVWDADGNLIVSGANENVGDGTEAAGGQSWITSPVAGTPFIAQGTQIQIGWTRQPIGSMLFSVGSGIAPQGQGGKVYVAQGANPGPLGTTTTLKGAPGAYIVYTPVSAPSATTSNAVVSATTALISGQVNPNGLDTSYSWQWGLSTSYENTTASADAGAGTATLGFSTSISGLSATTVYHYRFVATNAAGTTYGADQTFTTGAIPQAPTLTAPLNNSAQPMALAGQTFAWTYNSGGAVGGQTGYAFQVTPARTGSPVWWTGSAWALTETWITSSSGSVTIAAPNWTAGTSYTWTVNTEDANGFGVYATPFTVISEGPPNAPTLTAPAGAGYADLAGQPTFAWTYNASNAVGGETNWALRRKISGASTYSYWNAGSLAWQGTIVWNVGSIQSYAFPSAAWTDGNTYNWSVATQDAGGQGGFAADFSVVAQAAPTVTVSAPSGTILKTTPTVLWSASFPTGATQTAYQVRTFSEAQFSLPGFDPAMASAADDSGLIGGTATSYQIRTALAVGTPYRSFVNVTETGGETNGFNAQANFLASLDVPPTPAISAVATTDPATGCPLIQLTVECPLNLLTVVDSSFESGIGSFAGVNCALAQSATKALDGLFSLRLTASSAGAMAATSGTYPVTAGTSYVAMVNFLPATTTRSVNARLNWYSAPGAFITSVDAALITETSTSVWTQSTVQGVAPVGAAYATVTANVASPANGEVHYVDNVGLFLGATMTVGAVYGGGAKYGDGSVYGGTAWSLGGMLTTAQVTILRSDGVYVRGASPANPATVSQTALNAIVNDYEATPLAPYTYTAILLAQNQNAVVQSAISNVAGASLSTTAWWELDPTAPAGAVSAQPISFNPSNTEQSAAHTQLGQGTMAVVSYAMQQTDMTATIETFSTSAYKGFIALARSQKTIYFSSPFGESYYFRIAPAPGGMSAGMGNKAHDTQLLASTSTGPHYLIAVTGVSQPRPSV